MKKTLAVGCAVLLSLLLMSGGAALAQTMDVLNVMAEVQGQCTVMVDFHVDFGPVDPGMPALGMGTLDVNCSAGQPFNVNFDAGMNPGMMVPPYRHVADGMGNGIPYLLFQDAGLTMEWGDGGLTYMAPPFAGVGSGGWDSIDIYATLETPMVMAPAGVYDDAVMVNIMY